MSETPTTSNGHEIQHPVPVVTALEFREKVANEYGLNGANPAERMEQLKQLSVEGVAILLEDINKSVQGSADSLMAHDNVIKIGDQETIKLEDRYEVFNRLVEDIKNSPADINPARVGDVLALGVVTLHPFHDGNGRTARMLGLLFRDEYDSEEYEGDFDTIIEPRDRARERGGFMIFGYVPHGITNRSDASEVSSYLSDLLQHENEGAYIGCFGQAPLHTAEISNS